MMQWGKGSVWPNFSSSLPPDSAPQTPRLIYAQRRAEQLANCTSL